MEQIKQDQVTEKLLGILINHLKFSEGAENIPMDAELQALGLDSMQGINLLLDLEDSFDIAFPTSLLTEETFRTANTLIRVVQSLLP